MNKYKLTTFGALSEFYPHKVSCDCESIPEKTNLIKYLGSAQWVR